jgi:hypothetical protein
MLIIAIITANNPHQIAAIMAVVLDSFFSIIQPMEFNNRINADIIQNITQVFVIHGKIVA